jgi:hypothetical protein
LALVSLLVCCRRRYRRRPDSELSSAEGAYMVEKPSNTTSGADAVRHANVPPSQSTVAETLPILPLTAAHHEPSHERDNSQPEFYMRNLQRSASISSMPNPYDMYNPDRDLPFVPPSQSSQSDHAELLAAMPASSTHAAHSHSPSSFATNLTRGLTRDTNSSIVSSNQHSHLEDSQLLAAIPSSDIPTESSHPRSSFATNLSRGTTQATSNSRLSSASLLHSEMHNYQKRLEAHHEKELAMQQEPDDLAGPSIPSDPPPLYTENVPSTAASDVGHSAA